MMKTSPMQKVLLSLLLALLVSGCQGDTRTFAGFTYGGGGHTFSTEPAVVEVGSETTTLRCGTPESLTQLSLEWDSGKDLGQEVAVRSGSFKVEGKPSSVLQSGRLVMQSEKGEISHGSFDLKAKTEDGRVLRVVGSYSAELRKTP